MVLSWEYATALLKWSPSPSPEMPKLTAREYDILGSIARGHTIRQTARTLGIAAKTVENTQARLFRKLGVRNRMEALTIADALGLIDRAAVPPPEQPLADQDDRRPTVPDPALGRM
jgi:DNA-binding CsgD family transcriptional regulator